MNIRTRNLLPLFISLAVVILMFSCLDEEDKRKSVTKSYGDPDTIETGGSGLYKYELYIYADRDINRSYEFRKTASGCGGSGEWYLYRLYYTDYLGYTLYSVPEITHEQVYEAPSGQPITFTVDAADPDGLITALYLRYRHPEEDEFSEFELNYNTETEMYAADLPGEMVYGDSIEYYMVTEYYLSDFDTERTFRSPASMEFTIDIVSPPAKAVTGKPVTYTDGISAPVEFDTDGGTAPFAP